MFLSTEHEATGRCAVVEDDGTTCWLYLQASSDGGILADVWVYNAVPAVPFEEMERTSGTPPPAVKEVLADDYEYVTHADESLWTFEWSLDGDAVTLLRAGFPHAIATTSRKRGANRDLLRPGPWGEPFSSDSLA